MMIRLLGIFLFFNFCTTIESKEEIGKAKNNRYFKIETINSYKFSVENKIKTLTLNYNAISCPCPQWSESKFNDSNEERDYFYLEASNQTLLNADKLYNGENLPIKIQVKGQLVSELGIPLRYENSKVEYELGKVFRYTEIKVINK